MNIFIHELKAYRKSIVIWSTTLAAVSVLFILLFNLIMPDIEAFKTVMNSMPDVVRKLLISNVDMISTLEGFYSFFFVYIILCAAIQAMNIGVSILSKEVREKTADFLLTKPVSRMDIITAKLLAAFSCIVITDAIFLALTLLSTLTVTIAFNMKIFLMVNLTMFFVQMIFFALGVLVSVMAKKVKSVVSISLSTVFGFFIISMLGSIIGDEAVRYISPFKYYDLPYIVQHAAYETRFTVIGVLFVIVAIVAGYWIYIKKDVHSV